MNDSELITLIVKIIFAVASVAITYYVIPFLSELTAKYKDTKFEKFLSDAVKAAEQTIRGEKKGSEKKDEVFKLASDWLTKHKVDIPDSELDSMIESLVYSINHPEESAK